MIGRRCKARERLSRAPLIGRALRDAFKAPPLPTVLKGHLPRALCGPQGAPSAYPPLRSPRRNAPRGPAATAVGAHPDPYRTRKLSRPAPRVLQGRPCGRLGRRRPPGRVARGLGRGGANGAPGRGTREGPPSRLRAFPAFTRRRKGRRPPREPGGLLRSGPLARASRVAGGLLHVADPRRAFSAGRGYEGGLWFDVLARLLARPLPLQCFGGQTSRKGTL